MNVLHYKEAQATQVRENVERRLIHTEHLMMTVFDFTGGPQTQPDPPHSHPHEQITHVVAGEVIFLIEDQQAHLVPGDLVSIPAGKPHSIQLLTPTVRLVDCFTPIREDFLQP
jgi:quercetin dioxygenase-like cupin family protein